MLKRIAIAVAMLSLTAGVSGSQEPAAKAPMAAGVTCDGTVVIVRVSDVKPGMMPQMLEAARLHQAWYRAKGVTTNQIIVARVMERDEATHAMKFSDTTAISYHVNPPQKDLGHDADYDAFVKMYQSASTLKQTYMTCTPKFTLQ